MRVLEPAHFNQAKQQRIKKGNKRRFPVLLIVMLLLVAGGGGYWKIAEWQTQQAESQTEEPLNQISEVVKTGNIITFTGDEFRDLYRSVAYPNTQQLTEPPVITGNKEADDIIRSMAEARGYLKTSVPVAPITRINEPRLEGDDLLQPLAASAWTTLKQQAKQDGYPISIISGYRSPEYQRSLFTQRLYATGTSAERIAAGLDKANIESTLLMTAVPGYSRHHTGYTIDLWCEDGSSAFLLSRCYTWISANNFQKAKEHGWIPSYPEGTGQQGPEPEPWEYVWVGRDKVTN